MIYFIISVLYLNFVVPVNKVSTFYPMDKIHSFPARLMAGINNNRSPRAIL